MVRACTKSREGRTRAFAQSPPLPFRPCKEPWNPPRIFWLGTSETVDPACTSVERAVVGQEDRSGPKCFSSHLRAVRRKPRFGQTRASRQSDGAAADPAQYDLLQQATRESPMKEHSGVISARSSSRVSCGRKRRPRSRSSTSAPEFRPAKPKPLRPRARRQPRNPYQHLRTTWNCASSSVLSIACNSI